jgi:hypothetical protein
VGLCHPQLPLNAAILAGSQFSLPALAIFQCDGNLIGFAAVSSEICAATYNDDTLSTNITPSDGEPPLLAFTIYDGHNNGIATIPSDDVSLTGEHLSLSTNIQLASLYSLYPVILPGL